MAEMEELRKTLAPWNQQAEALDEKMTSAQMVIKDRASQRTLHFGSELQVTQQDSRPLLLTANHSPQMFCLSVIILTIANCVNTVIKPYFSLVLCITHELGHTVQILIITCCESCLS